MRCVLGWGDTEDMLLGGDYADWYLGGDQGFAHLPRADEPISPIQMKLLRDAEAQHQKRAVVVLTHFTVASFREDIALFDQQTPKMPAKGTLEKTENRFCMGTFEKLRTEFFELLGKRTITCILTGHSHRRGLYFLESSKSGISNPSEPGVVMYDPEGLDPSQTGQNLKPAIVVSDCGGPYPRYNRYGEFYGWGSDKPGGSVAVFNPDGSLKRVKVTRGGAEQNAPRLAVAIDYADILKKDVWFNSELSTRIFEKHKEREMLTQLAPDAPFYTLDLTLSNHLKAVKLAIESITFWTVQQEAKAFTFEIKGQDTYVLQGAENHVFYHWLQQGEAPDRFVAVTFKWAGNPAVSKRYDLSDPWIFEVKVERVEKPIGWYRYSLARPQRRSDGTTSSNPLAVTYRDVPDFAWRRRRGG